MSVPNFPFQVNRVQQIVHLNPNPYRHHRRRDRADNNHPGQFSGPQRTPSSHDVRTELSSHPSSPHHQAPPPTIPPPKWRAEAAIRPSAPSPSAPPSSSAHQPAPAPPFPQPQRHQPSDDTSTRRLVSKPTPPPPPQAPPRRRNHNRAMSASGCRPSGCAPPPRCASAPTSARHTSSTA